MNVIIWQRAGAALEWQRHFAVYYFSCRKRNPRPYLAPNRSHSPTDNHSSIRVFHLPYNGTFSHEVFPQKGGLMELEKWRPNVYDIRRHTKANPFSETSSLCFGVCVGKTAIFCHFRFLSRTQTHAIVVLCSRPRRLDSSYLPSRRQLSRSLPV